MINRYTYWIVTNNHNRSKRVERLVKSLLSKAKWNLNKSNHDYLIVIGGDGTYVRFLRKYYSKPTKIICINTGTVGFYAKFINDDLKDFVKIVTNSNNFIHPQILTININNQLIYNAMNELVIQSLNTVKLDVAINDTLYEKYMGTGILIATRTGATGQAKSNGGAIIFPNVDVIELVELAPTNHSKHHSFNSPVILSGNSEIKLNNFMSFQRCDLIIDGMRVRHINPKDQIVITKQDAPFSLCFSDDPKGYIHKLQKTFIKD
ncbi:MAG: NAD(+)/NADH kinase [Mycoplasmataceae bacterium]|nr:NAD(+)/NADH kinase [Mycoplasmataceae bacterium]